MAGEGTSDSRNAAPPLPPVFVDTSLGTHVALVVSPHETVADFKKKVCIEHAACFPSIGDVSVVSTKVRRKATYYHLSDSMALSTAFNGIKGTWFVQMDMAPISHTERNLEREKDYLVEKLHSSILVNSSSPSDAPLIAKVNSKSQSSWDQHNEALNEDQESERERGDFGPGELERERENSASGLLEKRKDNMSNSTPVSSVGGEIQHPADELERERGNHEKKSDSDAFDNQWEGNVGSETLSLEKNADTEQKRHKKHKEQHEAHVSENPLLERERENPGEKVSDILSLEKSTRSGKKRHKKEENKEENRVDQLGILGDLCSQLLDDDSLLKQNLLETNRKSEKKRKREKTDKKDLSIAEDDALIENSHLRSDSVAVVTNSRKKSKSKDRVKTLNPSDVEIEDKGNTGGETLELGISEAFDYNAPQEVQINPNEKNSTTLELIESGIDRNHSDSASVLTKNRKKGKSKKEVKTLNPPDSEVVDSSEKFKHEEENNGERVHEPEIIAPQEVQIDPNEKKSTALELIESGFDQNHSDSASALTKNRKKSKSQKEVETLNPPDSEIGDSSGKFKHEDENNERVPEPEIIAARINPSDKMPPEKESEEVIKSIHLELESNDRRKSKSRNKDKNLKSKKIEPGEVNAGEKTLEPVIAAASDHIAHPESAQTNPNEQTSVLSNDRKKSKSKKKDRTLNPTDLQNGEENSRETALEPVIAVVSDNIAPQETDMINPAEKTSTLESLNGKVSKNLLESSHLNVYSVPAVTKDRKKSKSKKKGKTLDPTELEHGVSTREKTPELVVALASDNNAPRESDMLNPNGKTSTTLESGNLIQSSHLDLDSIAAPTKDRKKGKSRNWVKPLNSTELENGEESAREKNLEPDNIAAKESDKINPNEKISNTLESRERESRELMETSHLDSDSADPKTKDRKQSKSKNRVKILNPAELEKNTEEECLEPVVTAASEADEINPKEKISTILEEIEREYKEFSENSHLDLDSVAVVTNDREKSSVNTLNPPEIEPWQTLKQVITPESDHNATQGDQKASKSRKKSEKLESSMSQSENVVISTSGKEPEPSNHRKRKASQAKQLPEKNHDKETKQKISELGQTTPLRRSQRRSNIQKTGEKENSVASEDTEKKLESVESLQDRKANLLVPSSDTTEDDSVSVKKGYRIALRKSRQSKSGKVLKKFDQEEILLNSADDTFGNLSGSSSDEGAKAIPTMVIRGPKAQSGEGSGDEFDLSQTSNTSKKRVALSVLLRGSNSYRKAKHRAASQSDEIESESQNVDFVLETQPELP